MQIPGIHCDTAKFHIVRTDDIPLGRSRGNAGQYTPLLHSVNAVADNLGALQVGCAVEDLLRIRTPLQMPTSDIKGSSTPLP